MEKVILKAEVRNQAGKKIAKDLRNKSLVPANVYRSGKAATSLTISDKDLRGVLHTKAGENVLITLKISGGESSAKDRTVLIKEIQRHPVRDNILHVDFNEISLTEVLKVNVPLVAHGEPVGVKVDGGLLEHVLRELSVECLPADIPAKIEVEVEALKIGEHILVKDIKVPKGVKVLNDPELIAMIVKAPKVEAPKEEVVPGGEEPELIRKKKEEEAAEGEEPKEAPAAAAKEPKKEEKK